MTKRDVTTQPMYVLDWLRQRGGDSTGDWYEYRLFCGGEIYSREVIGVAAGESVTCPSDTLLEQPFRLVAANLRSLEHVTIPRELALSFSCLRTHWERNGAIYPVEPSCEIAQDLSALLTANIRRLVSVAGLVRIRRRASGISCEEPDCPVPIAASHRAPPWPNKLQQVGDRFTESPLIHSGNPLPKAIETRSLQTFFERLPDSRHAERLVLAARLYATALELIHHHADVSYLMLIFAADTLANGFGVKPDVDYGKKENTKARLKQAAIKMGLTDDQTRQLVMASCADNPWTKERFIRFIIDHTTEEIWEDDDLFRTDTSVFPNRDKFEETIRAILDSRNGYVHSGRPYSVSIAYGIAPDVTAQVLYDLHSAENVIPPVAWFERVVNVAFRQCVKKIIE